MIKKILKKVMPVLLCAAMLAPCANVYALEGDAQKPVSVVPHSAECTDGTFTDGVIAVSSGSAVVKIYFPFVTEGMTVKYTAARDAEVKMHFEPSGKEITTTLEAKSSVKKIDFPIALTAEEQTITIDCSAPVTFTEWTFIPDSDEHDFGTRNQPTNIAYTANEALLQTATVLSADSPIALVRNAKRYLCTEHLDFKPVIENGTTYIPTEIAREMLRECVEEDRDNKRVTVKNEDSVTLVFDENGCDVTYLSGKTHHDTAALKIYGEHYCLPLRYVSEMLDKAVEYKDGVIIVDEKARIGDIMKSSEITGYIKETIATVSVAGRTLHVSQNHPNASDTNNGSENMPYKTINAATAVAQAGDTVLVHEGDYRETVSFANDGVQGSPITLKGAEGEEVVLNATEVAGKLTPYKDNIYVTNVDYDLGWSRKQLWINRKSYAEGRYPNEDNNADVPNVKELVGGLNPLWPTVGDIQTSDPSTVGGYYMESKSGILDQEDDYWVGALVDMHVHEGWSRSQATIEDSGNGWFKYSSNRGYLGGLTVGWMGGTSMLLDGDNAFITNSLKTVDVPGEWYMDDEYLYIIPPEDFDFENDVIEYKTRTLVLDLRKKSHINVENIKAFGGSASMLDAQLCMIKDCDFEYFSHTLFVSSSRDGYIDSYYDHTENEAHAHGDAGIYVGGADNVIKNNKLYASAVCGLFLGGRTSYVYNNLIEECNYIGSTNGGIFVMAEEWHDKDYWRGGHSIYYNTVSKTGRGSLIFNNPSDAIGTGMSRFYRWAAMDIAYNDFYSGGIYSGRDGGIFYAHGTQLGDNIIRTKLHKNLFWDYYVYDAYEGGIYYDAGVTELDGFCNVVFCTNDVGNFRLTSYNEDTTAQTMHKVNACDWSYGITHCIPEGKEGLTVDDYPNKFVFESGSTLSPIGRITPTTEENTTYYLKDVELYGEWQKNDNGTMRPMNSDSYAVLKNVDMADYDALEIAFTGNYYDDKGRVEFHLDSLDGDIVAVKSLQTRAPKMSHIDTVTVQINPLEGTHDLYLKFSMSNSISYYGVTPKAYDVLQDTTGSDKTLVAGEGFVTQGTWGSGWKKRELPPEPKSVGLKGSWGGYWVGFENVQLFDHYNCVSITFGTKGQYADGVTRIYIDSMDTEPVAEFVLDGNDWNTKVTKSVALRDNSSRTGVHEVYLEFDGDGKCADIYDVTFFYSDTVPERSENSGEYKR